MSDVTQFLALLRQGGTVEARQTLAGLPAGTPDARAALNEALFNAGDPSHAAVLQEASAAHLDELGGKQGAERALLLYNLGCFSLAEDDILTARLRLAEAARLRPRHAPSHHNLAIAQELMAEFEEAEESLRRAIAADPECGLSRVNLALIQALSGMRADALTALRHLAAAHPESPGLRYHLCRTLLERGTQEEAEEARDLIEHSADWGQHRELKECLAMALFRLKEFPEAEALFRQLLEEDAERPYPRLGLIKSLTAQEQFAELTGHAERLQGVAPSPEVEDLLELLKAM